MASIIFGPRILHALPLRLHVLSETFQYGPFNCGVQRRWKKPVDSARTRLEGRTRDHRLDKLIIQLKNLRVALALHDFISQQRNGFASLQLLSKWRHEVGMNIEIGAFLKKYPHIFHIYMHPVTKNHCCKTTQKMVDLIAEEDAVIRENETDIVQRLKKLLMISTKGTLNMHALWLIRRELGLPDDYRSSILPNHQHDLCLESPDTLSLVSWDEELAVAKVEEWREKEYTEKWLAESETKYAFPINFPTGFKIEKGFRVKLKNWQRLPYTKPYEKNDLHPIHNVERLEKRIVGILHELLSLTVEKMIPLERLSHFRRVFTMEVNLRELLLKYPGIFYISTKGSTQTVLLRESYSKGCLIEPNPVYNVRRKMLYLILSGCRNVGEPESAIWFTEYDQGSSHKSQNNTRQLDTTNSIVELEIGSDSHGKNHFTEEFLHKPCCDSKEN
ncbi:protein ROOT PRIMORDIUM DEFECTIVE 1-like [Phragmites australis]|uniref:protein ROOT PRIMORDIUM DEFECTIVE 1-like n=1 Tax=Phragmites australis TaxID=29695 RepID=UPI002D77F47D|nr:protein ROOT PRIMORDIUM DEFECTIVE 1-like [Phragmites australis]